MKILFHAVASFWRIKFFWSKLSSLENIIIYNKISFEIHNLTTFTVCEQRIVFSIWYMIIFNLNIRLGYKQSNAEICALRITFFNKIIRNHIMLLSSSSSSRCFGFCIEFSTGFSTINRWNELALTGTGKQVLCSMWNSTYDNKVPNLRHNHPERMYRYFPFAFI